MKEKIKKYIEKKYDYNTPILTADIREAFSDIKDGTIRQILRRLKLEDFLRQTGAGIYFRPKEVGILKKSYVPTEQVIRRKYLVNSNQEIIGYIKGFNFANELSLSTQTSHIMQIVSNEVSDKKRTIKFNNRTITVEAPKVLVTKNNFRLLQVLDLLDSFDKYSEIKLIDAKNKIVGYLKQGNLSFDEVATIVSKYPINTQLKFYKLGDIDGIT